jgi:hypothetical protein
MTRNQECRERSRNYVFATNEGIEFTIIIGVDRNSPCVDPTDHVATSQSMQTPNDRFYVLLDMLRLTPQNL